MQKRRAFSAEFKARVVLEVLSGAKTAAEICRKHQIKPQVFAAWKAQFDAYQQIGHFLTDLYNRKRIHSALGYLTPTEFAASLP